MTYITDSLKAIAENTSRHVIPDIGVVDAGTRITERWYDISERTVQKEEQPVEDSRSCSEIASDMWARIRGQSK